MRALRRNTGFSLVELLVVIAIMAMMIAIIVPVFRSIMNGNKASACTAQLQSIAVAIRTYAQDWQGVPPRFDALGRGMLDTDNADPSDDFTVDGRGLLALVDGEYIKGDSSLHCPVNDRPADPASGARPGDKLDPTYIQSYTGRDNNPAHPVRTSPATDAYGLLNQYKYLSVRGVTNPADPDFRRQLSRCVWEPALGAAYPVQDPTWRPDDRTVVLWCNWHEDVIKVGGEGAYFVLFWDGNVRRVPAYKFHDVPGRETAAYPVAGWRVAPSDAALR